MGREIRRVPPHWEHPKRPDGSYRPLFDQHYLDALAEWFEEHQQWERGEHRDQLGDSVSVAEYRFYEEWAGSAPEMEYYRTYSDEDATWYQVYETVSEGTPVTPPFETQAELVDYLVANGDFWDQQRRRRGFGLGNMPCDPWSRKSAEAFVYGPGWAPTFVLDSGGLQSGVEFIAGQKEEE